MNELNSFYINSNIQFFECDLTLLTIQFITFDSSRISSLSQPLIKRLIFIILIQQQVVLEIQYVVTLIILT